MRNHPIKSAAIFSVAIAFGLIVASSQKSRVVELEPVAERQPASILPKTIEAQAVDPEQVEVYEFNRRMKAVLPSKEVLTDIHYDGYLFIDWESNEKNRREGWFSFQIKNMETPPVSAKVSVSRDYSLLSIETPNPKTEQEENAVLFLKDLIAIFAFRTFEDTSGRYLATLGSLNQESGEKIWIKKKVRYENGSAQTAKIIKSLHEIRIGGSLMEASGVEETALGPDLKTSGNYVLKKLQKNDVAVLKRQPLNRQVSLVPSSLITDPKMAVVNPVSWKEMEGKLANLSTLNREERLRLFRQMVRDLRLNPDSLQTFASWLRSDLRDEKKRSMGIGILASVGTPEAQKNLVELFKEQESSSRETAHQILNAFATSGAKLTPESRGMLENTLERHEQEPDLAANAAYALGAAGEVKKILELAEKAKTKDEKMIYIDAMGNGGNSESIAFLLENVKSPDPSIREKAVFALRFVNDFRVKSVFEQAMNDTNINVRYSAVRALPFQPNPMEYSPLLKNCSLTQESGLKKICSEMLAGW